MLGGQLLGGDPKEQEVGTGVSPWGAEEKGGGETETRGCRSGVTCWVPLAFLGAFSTPARPQARADWEGRAVGTKQLSSTKM